MNQLYVHAYDKRHRGFVPVYRVYMTREGSAVVKALEHGWEQRAQAVELALNARREREPLGEARALAAALPLISS
jgi:hypothetical protein